MKLVKSKLIRVIGLVAAFPLMIGHAIDGGGEDDVCGELCNVKETYILSGGEVPKTSLQVGSNLFWRFLNQFGEYNQQVDIPKVEIDRRVPTPYTEKFTLQANIQNQEVNASHIGPLWLHQSNGQKLKLIHHTELNSFIDIQFNISLNNDFITMQSASVDSLPEYVLSGGSSPTNNMKNDSSLEVFLNSNSIYYKGFGESEEQHPIYFQAESGDILRIVLTRENSEDTANLKLVSPLWLFTPAGKGIKLYHGGQNNYSDGAFVDLQYVLP